MKKLAVIVSHPIQYYAPVFRQMSQSGAVKLKVFYTWGEGSKSKYDPGFQREVEWDIPLLDGYDHVFVHNVSKAPGTKSFNGIVNPTIIADIATFNPDAILVYGWSWNSHLKVLRHFSGKIPLWFRGDSNLIDKRTGWKSTLRYVFLKWVYSHVDKAFYVGAASKAYFKHFGLRDSQLAWAPHAVDNFRFGTSHEAEVAELRRHLAIPANGKVVLFAGKLEPKKDPLALVDAFSQLEGQGHHLLIVGNGVMETEVKLAASRSSAADRIHFMDFQNQQRMPIVYQACQLFCLPSAGPGETWGLAVNEAMAAGKPVLVSDKVGCAADLVKEGANGSVFMAGHVQDLKTRLQNLMSSPDALERMGERSRQMIGDWSFETQSKAFLDAIKSNILVS